MNKVILELSYKSNKGLTDCKKVKVLSQFIVNITGRQKFVSK